jgi:hypothetical protein
MSTDERTTAPARRRYHVALSLPADPSDEELARDWTLSAADKVELQGCRGVTIACTSRYSSAPCGSTAAFSPPMTPCHCAL